MRLRLQTFGILLALMLAQAAQGTEWFVGIYNYYFTPTNLTVAPGDKVTWVNMANTAHDTTQYDPNNPNADSLWTVDPFGRGDSFSFTFDTTGNYPYVCAVHFLEHPEQTGLVVVAQMNLPPSVSITNPANGAMFTTPANFTISADASDSDGSVVSVGFFVNGNPAGVSQGPAFSASINGLATGSYTLTAVATDNGGATTTSAPVSIVVQAPPMKFPLTVNAQPQNGGSVTLNPPQPVDGYTNGTIVTLTASAAEGFGFASWSGAITATENPITLTMDAAKSVTANFSPSTTPSYTLLVVTNPPEAGTVTASTAPNGPNGTYLDGTIVTLSATPSVDFLFTNWTGDVISSEAAIAITIHSNTVAAANFVASGVRHFTLTTLAVPSDLGTIVVNTPPPPGGRYEEGTVLTVTALPHGGSRFLGWSGDASGTSNVVTVVMTTNKTVIANFERIPIAYTLVLGTNPPGAGSILVTPRPRADGTYGGGATIAFAAIPNPGFRFVRWGGMVPIGATNNPLVLITDTNPLVPVQNLSVIANFEPITPVEFRNAAGTYAGLLLDEHETNFTTSGFISLRLSKTGAYRGTATIGGLRQSVGGQFDRFGYAPLVLRHGTLSGSLQLHDGTIAGLLTDGEKSPTLLLHRAIDPTNAPIFSDDYVLTFGAAEPVRNVGTARLRVSAKGVARVSGQLGDGTRFAARTFLSPDARIPLFVPLYHRRGVLLGWLNVTTNGTVQGSVRWIRPGDSRRHDFPEGFTLELPVTGLPENLRQSGRDGLSAVQRDVVCRPRFGIFNLRSALAGAARSPFE